ncbi:MAG TPA: VanZ family protein [Terriglobales bacterium]|nr:VanZ family protein [Terriglobales bacterium]
MSGLPETALPPAATQPFLRVRSILLYWLPAVAWMAMVLAASTDTFSARNTGQILHAVLVWIFGQVDAATFGLLHFLVRKSAHFTEYAILSALWFRASRVHPASLWRLRWALIGLIISLSVAIIDEIHQSFVPSRTSSARDVLLDFCGALFAQILIWYAVRRKTMVVAGA